MFLIPRSSPPEQQPTGQLDLDAQWQGRHIGAFNPSAKDNPGWTSSGTTTGLITLPDGNIARDLASAHVLRTVSAHQNTGYTMLVAGAVKQASGTDYAGMFNGATYQALAYVTGGLKFNFYYKNGSAIEVSPKAVQVGMPFVFAASGDGETYRAALKLDGDTYFVTGSYTGTSAYNTITCGAKFTGTGQTRNTLAAFWARALRENDLLSLVDNPWQLFQPADQRIWVPVSAGGGAVSLTIADSSHGHAADNVVLSSSTALGIDAAAHAHVAENVTLSTTSDVNLVIADASHGHVADSLTLTTAAYLSVADALHSHAADSVTLEVSGVANLVVNDASHTHAADDIVVTADTYLSVMSALHGHSADNVVFPSDATDSEKIQLILDILENRQTLDPVTGLYTLYADDGVTVLRTAQAWEDASGTIPFRGQGLGRLDAMQ